jgi:hypothetical protein
MTSQDYLVLSIAALWMTANLLGAAFTIKRVYSRWSQGRVSSRRQENSREAVSAPSHRKV